eukprot:COSAG02_NODE_1647_length_11517_cov_2.751533_13_plen_67_part_00
MYDLLATLDATTRRAGRDDDGRVRARAANRRAAAGAAADDDSRGARFSKSNANASALLSGNGGVGW